MQCSYFSGRIYVERTSEQCCLGYHNSQKVEGRSLMGQALKWEFGWSTSVKHRWLEKAYIICKDPPREGTEKRREDCREVWLHWSVSINQVFSSIMTRWPFHIIAFRSCSCVPLSHATTHLNLLKPSSLTHTLQEFIVLGFLDPGLWQ